MKYVPLQIISDYSLLESLIKIDDLIDFAKNNNIKTLALTDINTINGAIEFYNKCLKNSIKPIIGMNVYIDNYNFLLYAKNYEGYKNLCKLSTIASTRKLSSSDIKKYNKQLVCIIPIENKILYNGFCKIYEIIFIGSNKYIPDNNYNYIYLEEARCLTKKENDYLKYIYSIKNNYILENKKHDSNLKLNISFSGKMIENTFKLSELCNLEIEKHTNLIPNFFKDGNPDEYLKALSLKGLKKRLKGNVNKKYLKRLDYELQIIKEMNFSNYFLIVFDYVKYARLNDILTECRGSASGALVAYCLGITDTDPVKYDLLFERFLNKDRITMPDIDLDIMDIKREDLLNYCLNKYGENHFAKIITYQTLKAKAAIRDVGKILKLPENLINQLSKLVTYNENVPLLEIKKIKELCDKYPTTKQLIDIVEIIKNIKKNNSSHAAGVVISDLNLKEMMPLKHTNSGFLTGYTMEYLEELGLIKMDFLGLANLTHIYKICELIKVKNPKFNLNELDYNDKQVYNIFKNGDTFGIFQFESEGMKNFLKNLKPDNFDDLVAAIALFRPGPFDYIKTYINRKHKKEKIDYIHKDLENLLKPTFGIFIYQEQIIKALSIVASYTLSESDIVRRAISKKKMEVLTKEKEKFVYRALKNNYSKEDAIKIFDIILKFASYGFNKSHSVTYSQLAFKLAYLKTYYFYEFNSIMLNNYTSNKENSAINEIRKNTEKLSYVSINKSTLEYINKENEVIMPFTSIDKVNQTLTKNIIEERKNGDFESFIDFVFRTKNKNLSKEDYINLIKAFAFDEFSTNKQTLINNIDKILLYVKDATDFGVEFTEMPRLNEEDEFDENVLSEFEKYSYGFYINYDVLNKYKDKYKSIKYENLQNNISKDVLILGVLKSKKEIKTKKNKDMAFITIDFCNNNLDLVIFSEIFDKVKNLIENDIIYLKGKVEIRENKYSIIVNNIIKLN
ncbi:MAG: DNA polymerase III subunit alpha [Bacilli bacterium]